MECSRFLPPPEERLGHPSPLHPGWIAHGELVVASWVKTCFSTATDAAATSDATVNVAMTPMNQHTQHWK